jgi:GNAT superfamily N-acetyltransferase
VTRPRDTRRLSIVASVDRGANGRLYEVHDYSENVQVAFLAGNAGTLFQSRSSLFGGLISEQNEPRDKIAYLERFYIADRLRGTGLAERAFAVMTEKCRELGCWAIYTLFAPDDERDRRALLLFMQMRGFERITGPHQTDVLRKVLDPPAWRLRYFFRQVEALADPGPPRPWLTIVDAPCLSEHCAERDLALSILGTGEIRVLKRAAQYPDEVLLALFAHEFGHLLDPTPDEPWGERRADEIGGQLLGHRINYDERDMQTIGPGRHPRPEHLHQ